MHFVHDLARDAKVWSSLRYHLRDHVHYMNEFTKGYLRFSGINYNEGKLLVDISEFEATIHERMNSLDQTLRDLLQFVSLFLFLFVLIATSYLNRNSHGFRSMRRVDLSTLPRV